MHRNDRTAAAGRFRRLADGLADYRRRQRDYLRLQDMPQSLLDDIGVTRDQVRPPKWRSML